MPRSPRHSPSNASLQPLYRPCCFSCPRWNNAPHLCRCRSSISADTSSSLNPPCLWLGYSPTILLYRHTRDAMEYASHCMLHRQYACLHPAESYLPYYLPASSSSPKALLSGRYEPLSSRGCWYRSYPHVRCNLYPAYQTRPSFSVPYVHDYSSPLYRTHRSSSPLPNDQSRQWYHRASVIYPHLPCMLPMQYQQTPYSRSHPSWSRHRSLPRRQNPTPLSKDLSR